MKKHFVIIALLTGISGQVCADGYYGANYTRVGLNGAEPTALDVKLGAQMSDLLSFELRAGVPVTDDSGQVSHIDIDYEVKYLGVLSRVGAFRDRGGVYGLIGFMDVTINLSTSQDALETNESDLVYGVGAEFGANKGFSFEYMTGIRDLENVSWLNFGLFKKY